MSMTLLTLIFNSIRRAFADRKNGTAKASQYVLTKYLDTTQLQQNEHQTRKQLLHISGGVWNVKLNGTRLQA